MTSAELGILSAALSLMAFVPYIRDTLAGRTLPHRASWLIWSVLSSIALASQAYEGATASLWFAGAKVSGTIVVFLLSLRHGMGGLVSPYEVGTLIVAALGLVIWAMSDTAAYTLTLTIGISLLGGVITVLKSYRAGNTETLSMWFLSFLGSILAMLSVGSLDWLLLAYPLYLFVLNGAIVLAILLGRYRVPRGRALADPQVLDHQEHGHSTLPNGSIPTIYARQGPQSRTPESIQELRARSSTAFHGPGRF